MMVESFSWTPPVPRHFPAFSSTSRATGDCSLILADFRDGHSGADAGWRRNRRRHLGGGFAGFAGFAGYGLLPEVAAAATATAEEEFSIAHPKHMTAIMVGVATGVSVWLATRFLDRLFGISGRIK